MSIEDLANDPLAQKSILRLEPLPKISLDVDKEKGIVFYFEEMKLRNKGFEKKQEGHKLMDTAIKTGLAMSLLPRGIDTLSEEPLPTLVVIGSLLSCVQREIEQAFQRLALLGPTLKKPNHHKSRRIPKGKDEGISVDMIEKKQGEEKDLKETKKSLD